MAESTDLHFLSLLETAELVRSRKISPVELTRLILDRISKLDPHLNSYAYVMEKEAIEAAAQAEKEIGNLSYRGPLHGIPLAVKDLCYTKGIPTRGGLQVLDDFVPTYDASVVSRIKAVGGIILGKLSLTEGAVGGYHRNYPLPLNPWGDDLWPGSSSSGSGIATATGLCYAAIGTDTGGSIRFPAMACGIVGLKPTYDLVSRHGILPLAESLDHVGPMTRTVADAAAVLQVIASDQHRLTRRGEKLEPEMTNQVKGLRIGYDSTYSSNNTDERLVRALEKALEQLESLGAEIIEVKVPDVGLIRETWKTIATYEAAKAHAANYPSRADEYGRFFRDFLETGYNISEQDYLKATEIRNKFSNDFCRVLSGMHALACPGGGIPFKIPAGLLYGSMREIRNFMEPYTYFRFTIPANFAGVPSLSFPCGLSKEGLLYTMQLIGNHFNEPELCRIGHAYQQISDWHLCHPTL